jgi:hypothetical protein
MHAIEHHGRVPIGFRKNTKQWNSMIYSGTSKRFVLFGHLFASNDSVNPKVFYCPTESNPQMMFNTPENPWPPGPQGSSSQNVFSGYAGRPEYQIPDDAGPDHTSMPRLDKFASRAILSDLISSPTRVLTRHEQGVNVLYGDASAQWLPRERFWTQLEPCTDPQGPPNSQWNDQQDLVWQTGLDQP